MPIAEGATIPAAASGFIMQNGAPTKVSLGDLVGGKKAVIFGIPGAFTPTCSNDHLPSFVQHAAALQGKGVDNIICLATNDIFVLSVWNQANGAPTITMLADGNSEISRALDLGLDASGLGLGFRTTRFAMVVEDNKVKALHVEEKPGACTVSAADSILEKV